MRSLKNQLIQLVLVKIVMRFNHHHHQNQLHHLIILSEYINIYKIFFFIKINNILSI